MPKARQQQQLARVGGRIRTVRKGRGLDLHDLARLSGISASALSLIETGKRDLRVTSLCRIAAALRIEARDLLGDPAKDHGDRKTGGPGGYDLDDYS